MVCDGALILPEQVHCKCKAALLTNLGKLLLLLLGAAGPLCLQLHLLLLLHSPMLLLSCIPECSPEKECSEKHAHAIVLSTLQQLTTPLPCTIHQPQQLTFRKCKHPTGLLRKRTHSRCKISHTYANVAGSDTASLANTSVTTLPAYSGNTTTVFTCLTPQDNNQSLRKFVAVSCIPNKSLCCLCRESAPWQARASMFCPTVTVLGKCMATRYTAYSENLWRAAAAVFNSIVNLGLPAVNKAYFNPQDLTPPTSSWTCLAEVLEWFLLGKYTVAIDIATIDAVLDEPNASQTAKADADTDVATASTSATQPVPTSAAEPSHSSASLQTPTASGQISAVDTAPAAASTTAATLQQPEASISFGNAQADVVDPPQTSASSSSIPPLPHALRSSRSQGSSKAPSRDPSFKAVVSDTEQSSSDAELETSVVDTLTDAVLTACSHAPEDVKRRLIAVLDQAAVRPKSCHIPNSAAGIPFHAFCTPQLILIPLFRQFQATAE